MNVTTTTLVILDKVLETRSKEIAIKLLERLANRYNREAYGYSPKMKFRNKRMKQKWYLSLATRLRNEIQTLK